MKQKTKTKIKVNNSIGTFFDCSHYDSSSSRVTNIISSWNDGIASITMQSGLIVEIMSISNTVKRSPEMRTSGILLKPWDVKSVSSSIKFNRFWIFLGKVAVTYKKLYWHKKKKNTNGLNAQVHLQVLSNLW